MCYAMQVMGQDVVEGEVSGWYGIWYSCWKLKDPSNARRERVCQTVSQLEHIPEW